MRLNDAVTTSIHVSETSSRKAKIEALADLLRRASPLEARIVAAYLSGVLPQGRIGVGWRTLTELPAPAYEPELDVLEVDAVLSGLAQVSGAGSTVRRRDLLSRLYARATAQEQRFLTHLLGGELRQGALDAVMGQAVARAAGVDEALVRRAVMLSGSVLDVVEPALRGGASELAAITLQVGRPIAPMLAGSAPEVSAVVDELEGPVAVECKLDGIRMQIHKNSAGIHVFTRSLDDITERVPEVVELVERLPAGEVVLDGEAIALRDDGRPQPFQVTGSRTASRTSGTELARTVPLTSYFFDVLHLDGQTLIDEPMRTRRAALEELWAPTSPTSVVPSVLTDDQTVAEDFFASQVAYGHEGVVIKQLESAYAAGRRGGSWVKVKPRHTLDLVVLAVEWGSGRRTGKLSNIHLGARNPDTGGFVMLGKTFKGMTDQMLEWQTVRFLELATERGDWVVKVRPEQVVEIAFDGLQKSSRYPAGLALRFARVLRYRNDKTATEADTIETVRRLARG